MATVISLLQMSDTMTEGAVVSWLKHEGDTVRVGEAIAEIETDKATIDLEAQEDGVFLKRLVDIGVTVPVGTPLAVTGKAGEPIPDISASLPAAGVRVPESGTGPATNSTKTGVSRIPDRVRSSPSARKLARSVGIDIGTVAGTGPGGRIVRRDIEAAKVADHKPFAAPGGSKITSIPISRPRRKMIERLVQTHQTVPVFSLTRRIRMDAAKEFRASLRSTKTYSAGIGYTELVVKAVARAMDAEPRLNARLTGENVTLLDEVNVGVAVGLDDSVVVPVIRGCRAKHLAAITTEYRELVRRAGEGSLLAAIWETVRLPYRISESSASRSSGRFSTRRMRRSSRSGRLRRSPWLDRGWWSCPI